MNKPCLFKNDFCRYIAIRQVFHQCVMYCDNNLNTRLNICLSNDYLVGDAFFVNDKDNPEIMVGNMIDKLSSKSYDDIFTKQCVACFHELRHASNFMNKYSDISLDNGLDKCLAYSDISNYNNQYYNENYDRLPHEIDAEYHGVMDAYNYMCSRFPNKKDLCEKLILDYVNDKAKNYCYFLKSSDYRSIEDVDDAFYNTLNNSKTSFRQYHNLHNSHDLVMGFLQEYQLSDVFTDIHNSNGSDCDRKIAAVTVLLKPKIRKDYDCITESDISCANVFGKELSDELLNAMREKRFGISDSTELNNFEADYSDEFQ